ncbi:ferritin-like domain-containing protein [Paucilactobacillus wasatchensis]|uniref:Ferroxidase Non-specific DNA-binding protein n=1 Tax=Paucilactobacillus wasatchensis TaxID=1335616 RepID=A0A0D1A7Y5_9LACO|nr:ferritin-like domain-containing protein [Paucilactobacillus wasatchensis]KIS03832.1 Ferroxidase Non-specific DNA-binding protein [Paucilactobacillus wasatchensis]
MTNVDTQYEAELKQADLDHHKPTAGAMTGHILSNLLVNNVKLHQAVWYLKGLQSLQLKPLYEKLIQQGRQNFDQLAVVLLDENELPPSTVSEYVKYSMLEEDGRNKYFTAEQLVDITAHDYATQNMFIDRAIVLAQKETRPAMAAFLTNLRGQNNHSIQVLQAVLGKQAWDGLVEEDEDDDED